MFSPPQDNDEGTPGPAKQGPVPPQQHKAPCHPGGKHPEVPHPLRPYDPRVRDPCHRWGPQWSPGMENFFFFIYRLKNNYN